MVIKMIKQQYEYVQPRDPSTGILRGLMQMLPRMFVYEGAEIPVNPILCSYVNTDKLNVNECAISVGLLSTQPVIQSIDDNITMNDDESIWNYEEFRKARFRLIAYAPDCILTKHIEHTVHFDEDNNVLDSTYKISLNDCDISSVKCTCGNRVLSQKIIDPPFNSIIQITNNGYFNEGDTILVQYDVLTSGVYIVNELIHCLQKNIDTYMNRSDNYLFKDYKIAEYKIGVITMISDALFADNYHGASFDILVSYPSNRILNKSGETKLSDIDISVDI